AGLPLHQGHVGGNRPGKAGRQVVDDHDPLALIDELVDHVAADVAGAAGDENAHSRIRSRWPSAADLKFLHHRPQARSRKFRSKAALESYAASAPLFPKFVSNRAAIYHELRKRGTSAASTRGR